MCDFEEEIGKDLITTKALYCIDLERHVVYWSQYFNQLYKCVVLSAWLFHSAVESRFQKVHLTFYKKVEIDFANSVYLFAVHRIFVVNIYSAPVCFFTLSPFLAGGNLACM